MYYPINYGYIEGITAPDGEEQDAYILGINEPVSDNVQNTTTGQTTPCLQPKIDKTRHLIKIHFSDTSNQNVEDRLKRVILHDLEHKKQGNLRKSDEK